MKLEVRHDNQVLAHVVAREQPLELTGDKREVE